jgi:hypothetical protein
MEATFAGRPLGDSELVEAIEENLAEALTSFGRHTQATVHASPELTWFSTGVPLARFNGVVRTRLPAKAIDQTISDTLAQFQDRALPMVWWTGPLTQPQDLGSRLLQHGLVHAGDTPDMALDLGVVEPPTGGLQRLKVKRVSSQSSLEHYIRALVQGFGDPDWVGRAFLDFFSDLGFVPACPGATM